jgi:hypothetical protein
MSPPAVSASGSSSSTSKKLLRQLKGIGSNINRLTVLANMGKVQVIGLDKAVQELSEVSAALRSVMEGR